MWKRLLHLFGCHDWEKIDTTTRTCKICGFEQWTMMSRINGKISWWPRSKYYKW